MVGISITSAPCSASWRLSWLACSRVRVTTTRRPNSGRRSNQLSFFRNDTTSPMMVTAGAVNFSASTTSAMVVSVPVIVFCRPVVPQRTMATGVLAAMPLATSSAAIRRMRSTPMRTTLVPGIRAICAQSRPESGFVGSSCPVMTW